MFSSISELLKPATFQKDGARKDRQAEKDLAQDGSAQESASAALPVNDNTDVFFLSCAAIRALLGEPGSALSASALTALTILTRLEEKGITQIPMRDGQSVSASVIDAAGILEGRI